MADQKKSDSEVKNQGGKNATGDPGRTPGIAEGDRELVEEDIRNQEKKGKI